MSFLSPDRLLASCWRRRARRRLPGRAGPPEDLRRASSPTSTLLDRVAPRKPGWRRHVPAALFLLAIGALVGRLRPADHDETQVPRERATIILAIDTSLSMKADDVAPTRIEAAKDAAVVVRRHAPAEDQRRPRAVQRQRRRSRCRRRPTTTPLKRGIESLELGERTAIGEAIFTCARGHRRPIPPDDEGTAAAGPHRADVRRQDHRRPPRRGRPRRPPSTPACPVSTIAFGTDEGTIADPATPRVTVPVPVDRDALEHHRRRDRRHVLRRRHRGRAPRRVPGHRLVGRLHDRGARRSAPGSSAAPSLLLMATSAFSWPGSAASPDPHGSRSG